MLRRLAIAGLVGLSGTAAAQRIDSLQVALVASPHRVDGVLDEPFWSTAASVSLPFERYPGNNTASPVSTECRVVRTASALLLGCVARDPEPRRIRAAITSRDNLPDDDRIVFTVDPSGQAQRAYEFTISAAGSMTDAVFDQRTSSSDATWDGFWDAAARRSEIGYVVEASIPFSSLLYSNDESAPAWRFVVTRVWPRGDRVVVQSIWEDRSNTCWLCQSGRLVGLHVRGAPTAASVTPTVTSARVERFNGASRIPARDNRTELGIDGRWTLTTSSQIDGTVNPDFSNVEADAPVLSVNQRFAINYPERRPFFVQGADAFATPLSLVVTRSIVDPDWGLKLVTREGASIVAVLAARDASPTIIGPAYGGSRSAAASHATSAVAVRGQRAIGQTTIGVLATDRRGGRLKSTVGAFDVFLRPHATTSISTQAAMSRTTYGDALAAALAQPAGVLEGYAAALDARFDTRRWSASASADFSTEQFRADVGFMPRVGGSNAEVQALRNFWGRSGGGGWFTQFSIGPNYIWSESTDGRFYDRWPNARITYVGPGQLQIYAVPRVHELNFGGKDFAVASWWMQTSAAPMRSMSFAVVTVFGKTVDFANVREARMIEISPRMTARLGQHVLVSVRGFTQYLADAQGRIVQEAVAQATVTFNATPRTSLRLTLSPTNTWRVPDAFAASVDPETSTLGTQVLFSHRANAESELLIGYGDTRVGGIDAQRVRSPVAIADRTFYVKARYNVRAR